MIEHNCVSWNNISNGYIVTVCMEEHSHVKLPQKEIREEMLRCREGKVAYLLLVNRVAERGAHSNHLCGTAALLPAAHLPNPKTHRDGADDGKYSDNSENDGGA